MSDESADERDETGAPVDEDAPPDRSAEDQVDDAAEAALLRARAAAREKGLRPGLKPMRRRQIGRPTPGAPTDRRDPLCSGTRWTG